MSVVIKSLTIGIPVEENAGNDSTSNFNILSDKDKVLTLYKAEVPGSSTTLRAAIVKSIRLVNTAAATVKITLYFNRIDLDGRNQRRLLTPSDMPIAPNSVYLDDSEITLEPGDMIQAKTDTAGVVQYLISGVERDAV